MFRRVLIANRGEIAVRIIRACREAGITTIGVYSAADQESLHTFLADETICIGPPPASESYLNIANIIAAAEVSDAQAIHPGYGFLAENEKFAATCRDCNITFIGPSPEAIALSGDKSACRKKVEEAGVPVVPGSEGEVTDPEQALDVARSIGFPVLVKASFGGGGKGMRVVHNEAALQHAVNMASQEAESNFGSGGLYLEKYIERARHIEFQILADTHGKVIALGERECSVQRRHQKLIEETPAPNFSNSVRSRMSKMAIRAAKAIGYTNAGTVEFLVTPDNNFYFIEFNARIQVEHPVTEEVTGIDLVREQLRIAAGEALGYNAPRPNGWAIEARVCAEDPAKGFAPAPGEVGRCHFPGGPGIRVDTHLFPGYKIPPHYDSLIAKVIAHGKDRDEALQRLVGALDEFTTEGVTNTSGLCGRIIAGDRFRRGDLDTHLIDEYLTEAQ